MTCHSLFPACLQWRLMVFAFPVGVLFWEYTDPNIILPALALKVRACSIEVSYEVLLFEV